MRDSPRYSTIRDYLRVLRAHRLLIILMAIVFAAAGYAVSRFQEKRYEAQSTLSFREPAEDFDLINPAGGTPSVPGLRAAVTAELIKRNAVVESVKRQLRTSKSLGTLKSSVSANVEARTGLAKITADSTDPEFAAALANAFADQAARNSNRAEKGRLLRAAASVRKEYRKRKFPDPTTKSAFLDRVTRIESLAAFASPVSVAQRAGVPDSPSEPRPTRNTILGLIVGLTLGILAAFLRDALDRRLRGSREIQEYLALPVLGHVGDRALGRSAISANGKHSLTQPDVEAFRILRTNLDFFNPDNPPKSIAVTSGLPDEGKSTVALALAGVSVAAGRSTILVDCDLRRPSLAERLEIERVPGLTDYIAGKVNPAEVLHQVRLGEQFGISDGPNGAGSAGQLVCIPAGSPVPNPAEMLASKRFRMCLTELTAAYDLVVLDTSPLLSVVDTRELLPSVSMVLLCVRSLKTTHEEARAAKEALERLPHGSTAVVVTGVRAGDEADYGYYSYAYSYGPTG